MVDNFVFEDPNIQARRFSQEQRIRKAKEDCLNKQGYVWNENTQTCDKIPQPKQEPKGTTQDTKLQGVGKKLLPKGTEATGQTGEFKTISTAEGRTVQDGVPGVIENGVFFPDDTGPKKGKVIFDEQGNATGFVRPDGTALTGLNPNEVAGLLKGGETAADAQQQPNLAGQVGEFGELGISPTGIDAGEASIQGIVGSIPSAIRTAGTLALLGGVKGGATGGSVGGLHGSLGGAAIGAGVGLISGFASGIISNIKSQRTGSIAEQKLVLTDGKSNLQDIITNMKADPANRSIYLSAFNTQLAKINQAYRQMKLDTQEDLGKFNVATADLGDFNVFYNLEGERDILVNEMKIALQTPSEVDYRILELMMRRGK